MYIQRQHWEGTCDRLLIVSTIGCGTVQVDILQTDEQRERYHADCILWALLVDEGKTRRKGVGGVLVKTAEEEAKKCGCKSIALEWSLQESPFWVRDWYERLGYEEKVFGKGYSLMVKELK